MTLTDKLTRHMATLFNVADKANNDIVLSYMVSIGVNPSRPFNDIITDKSIPAYASITRAIRKSREKNVLWQKATSKVSGEVSDVKSEVGY